MNDEGFSKVNWWIVQGYEQHRWCELWETLLGSEERRYLIFNSIWFWYEIHGVWYELSHSDLEWDIQHSRKSSFIVFLSSSAFPSFFACLTTIIFEIQWDVQNSTKSCLIIFLSINGLVSSLAFIFCSFIDIILLTNNLLNLSFLWSWCFDNFLGWWSLWCLWCLWTFLGWSGFGSCWRINCFTIFTNFDDFLVLDGITVWFENTVEFSWAGLVRYWRVCWETYTFLAWETPRAVATAL